MRFLMSIGVVLLIVTTVFALQNPTPVTVTFLRWSRTTTIALALIGAAVFGALVVYLASLVSQGNLRGRLRAAESRLREWDRNSEARERTDRDSGARPAEPPAAPRA